MLSDDELLQYLSKRREDRTCSLSNVFCLASLPLSNSSESAPPAHRGLFSFALLSSCMPGLGTRPPPDPSSPLPRSNNRSGTCDPPTRALIPSPRSSSSCARAPACDFGLADPDASETPPPGGALAGWKRSLRSVAPLNLSSLPSHCRLRTCKYSPLKALAGNTKPAQTVARRPGGICRATRMSPRRCRASRGAHCSPSSDQDVSEETNNGGPPRRSSCSTAMVQRLSASPKHVLFDCHPAKMMRSSREEHTV